MERFADRGRTIVLTTHYLAEAEALAERIVVMEDGRVRQQGRTRELLATLGATMIKCRTSLPATQVEAMAAVMNVTAHKSRLTVHTRDAAATMREWLAADMALAELTIANPGLDALLGGEATQETG